MAENIGSSLLEQLKSFAPDAETAGKLHADFLDLIEACEWFLSAVKEKSGGPLTADELANFLIEMDVAFVGHTLWHLNSFREYLDSILANFPSEEAPEVTCDHEC
jgi:hypothetical protein